MIKKGFKIFHVCQSFSGLLAHLLIYWQTKSYPENLGIKEMKAATLVEREEGAGARAPHNEQQPGFLRHHWELCVYSEHRLKTLAEPLGIGQCQGQNSDQSEEGVGNRG